MESDRHTPDGGEPDGGEPDGGEPDGGEPDGGEPDGESASTPPAPAPHGASASTPPIPAPHDATGPAPSSPVDATGADASRAYAYGDPPEPATGGAATAPGPPAAPSAMTALHPPTAQRGLTAPRAVLRPVPEGFPTPPPRPARPHRRPAPKAEDVPPARPRRLLITGIAVAAVLALIVLIGGGILLVRSLEAGPPAADPAPADGQDPAGAAQPGQVEVGGVTFTEQSTEVGVRTVHGGGAALEPEGEFVVVVFEVDNRAGAPLQVPRGITLETSEGSHQRDREASIAYTSDSLIYGTVAPGETEVFHAVFDVPIGAEPTGLRVGTLDESGVLPLGG